MQPQLYERRRCRHFRWTSSAAVPEAMISAVGRAFGDVITSIWARLGRDRHQGLPPGFVLPSKGNVSPRSADSQSTVRHSITSGTGKSVRFLVPAYQAGGDKKDANYVVVTPQDSPRHKRRKLRRRKKKAAPPVVTSLADPTAGRRKAVKAYLPGLLGSSRTDSDSESDAGDSKRRSTRRGGRSVSPSVPVSRLNRMKTRSAPTLVGGTSGWSNEPVAASGSGSGSNSVSSPKPRSGRRRRPVPSRGPLASLRRARSAVMSIGSTSDDDSGFSSLGSTRRSLKQRRVRGRSPSSRVSPAKSPALGGRRYAY